MKVDWVDGAEISTRANAHEFVISANREGLLSLAKQLTSLADETAGTHIHYDAQNALEEGSSELVIEKI